MDKRKGLHLPRHVEAQRQEVNPLQGKHYAWVDDLLFCKETSQVLGSIEETSRATFKVKLLLVTMPEMQYLEYDEAVKFAVGWAEHVGMKPYVEPSAPPVDEQH